MRPGFPERLETATARALAGAVRAGVEGYERRRHLPWLARATPQEIASDDPAVAAGIVARLGRALRAERRRGRAGHWTYDLNRHIALLQALAAETGLLARAAGRERPVKTGRPDRPA